MSSRMDWDKFTFEFKVDYDSLLPSLISIEAYKEAALNLVIPPDWRTRLDRLNRVRVVHGTTALEGNPLSEEEVALQMEAVDAGNINDGRVTKEQLQIRNAGVAQAWVRSRFVPGSPPVSYGDLLEMHRLLTHNTDTHNNEPGRWRTFSVQVGAEDIGGVHLGAPFDRLTGIMDEFVGFVNSKRLSDQHPVVKALLSHFFLVTIHPFGDGNGRISRLLEAGILFQQSFNVHGFYGLSNYFYRHEREYKLVLQECRQAQPFDVTPFIRFGVAGFASELKGINNFIKTKLNRVVYREMLVRAYNQRVGSRRRLLNQREYSLLHFLLTETEPGDPFSESPSRKIRLAELQNVGYIRGAYKNLTPRTFVRELLRLDEMGFIRFYRDEEVKDSVLELNFGAVERY